MAGKFETQLTRRERQIMDIVYAHGEASVNQVWEELPTPPSRTATRTPRRRVLRAATAAM